MILGKFTRNRVLATLTAGTFLTATAIATAAVAHAPAASAASTSAASISAASTSTGPTAQKAAAAAVSALLKPGQVLHAGQYRQSPNKQYAFVMQTDGNAVLYKGRTALWASMTNVRGAYITLQRDGNLVVFANRKPIWNTSTYGSKPAYLAVQNDGNLVIYNTAKKAVWSRWMVIETLGAGRTLKPGQLLYSRNRVYRLQMQTDGNLVLVKYGKTVLWNSGTGRHNGAFAVMQGDGNLVVYLGRKALWSSRTAKKGSMLQMQNDGNAVIYLGRTPVWATKTAGR
ncbi:MAG TPA: hypothetical protein VGD34_05200 [Kribbella sp.]